MPNVLLITIPRDYLYVGSIMPYNVAGRYAIYTFSSILNSKQERVMEADA